MLHDASAVSVSVPPAVPQSSVLTLLPPSTDALQPHKAAEKPHVQPIASSAAPPSDTQLAPTSRPESSRELQLQAQNDALRAQLAAHASSEDPQELKQLTGGVRQMMEVYLTKVAPNERFGTNWRSVAKGEKRAERLSDLLTKGYEPVLFAVMQRLDSDVWVACDAVEALRNGRDWTPFIKELPKLDKMAKTGYKARLLSVDFARSTLDCMVVTQPDAPGSSEVVDKSEATKLTPVAPPVENGAIRYLALDPSTSCGWAMIHVKDEQVVAIDVGVIDVKAIAVDGLRGLELQKLLRPLLDPPPACVFSESYFMHRHKGAEVNVKLRAAIEMELALRKIDYLESAPQTWKKSIVGKGNAEKTEIKDALEKTIAISFPAQLFILGKWLKFRDDASDATGIGLHGVKQRHSSLSYSPSLRMSAPGKPRACEGTRVAAQLPVGTAETNAAEVVRPLRDQCVCTLADDCTNWSGLCQCEPSSSRPPERRNDFEQPPKRFRVDE